MYNAHFGLEQSPFKITPDTRLFFPGGNRGAVLQALVYAVANGEGIVKVVGEVGSGKTMLCRMLQVELPEHVEIVYLANPNFGPDEILHAIALELKIETRAGDTRLTVVHRLQDFLLSKHAANRRVVAFIEEAQGMPLETLEEIRLLSNLETSQDKLLQIVLFGQPELDQLLAGHQIRQLRERITYSFDLEPFKTREIRDYLDSRLRASGYRGGELFQAAAVREVTRASAGLLRRINILADKSLLAAYAENAPRVTRKHVKRAARDSQFTTAAPAWPWLAALAGVGLAVGVGAWIWSGSEPIRPEMTAADRPAQPPPTLSMAPAAEVREPMAPQPPDVVPTDSSAIGDVTGRSGILEEVEERSADGEQPTPALVLPDLLTLDAISPDLDRHLSLDSLAQVARDEPPAQSGSTR